MGGHDTLFKRAFAVPEHASGELRSVLPAEVMASLDLTRLELLPGSFVDAELRERRTDLLFRAPLVDSGRPVYVYFLLEHQSTPDPLMPWRSLEYLQRIWASILRDEPGRTTLPPVVTVVLYNGDEAWNAPRRFQELIEGFDEVPALARLVPDFELVIDDLPMQGDDALAQRPLRPFPKVALWLLRDGRSVEQLFAHLQAWARELERLVEEVDAQDTDVILRYILRVAGETPFDVVRRRVARVAPVMEEPMARIEEQLIQKGVRQGVRATLARLLHARFGALSPELEQRIERASPEELERYIDRVVTASRAEEVFEPLG